MINVLEDEHVMIDLETLGTRPGSMIVAIGACTFSVSHGIGKKFYRVIDAASGPGMIIDPDTIKWWMGQPDDARALFNDAEQVSLALALQQFKIWWKEEALGKYVWGHGASFDPVLLAAAYFHMGLREPWDHRDLRDTRTVFKLTQVSAADFPAIVKHHALDDAISQALAVIEAHRRLGKDLA